MTSDELNAAAAAGKVTEEQSSNQDSGASPEVIKSETTEQTDLSQYIPIFVNLQSVQKYLSAAPLFTPKTFQDQIQFVDDGKTKWIYFYANNQWNGLEVSTTGYGDGSDGAVTLNGSTTFSFASLASNVYTLNRDIFCSALTLQAGVTLKPNGFKVYSQQAIDIFGHLSLDGGPAGRGVDGGAASGAGTFGGGGAGGVKGLGVPSGSIKQPGDGKDGKVGMPGSGAAHNGVPNTLNGLDGLSEPNCILPNNAANGGKSGSGAINGTTGFTDNSSTGGIGGSVTRTTKPSALDIIKTLVNALGAIGCNPSPGSGAGGGSGYGNNPGNDAVAGGGGGGGSGAPAGIGWFCSPAINVHVGGSVTSNGGDGGRGGDGGTATGPFQTYAGGGAGGGAPGNGGLILFITPSYTNLGTVTANAGAPGGGGNSVGGGTGTTASSGSSGQIVQIVP